jgi:competence protein ComGC
MKTSLNFRRSLAFSLIDLVVVVLMGAAILALVLMLPALAPPQARSSKIGCVNNLKQVALAFRLWAGDNDDKYPMQTSTNLGGTMELVANSVVEPHFVVMSNELATPKILVCPNDVTRNAAANFSSLRDTNLSYFVVPEADEMLPQLWLSGDRNLATNGKALKPGLFTVTTNSALGWTAEQHQHNGNLALADGSVQQFANARLPAFLSATFTAYSGATSNTTFRILLP